MNSYLQRFSCQSHVSWVVPLTCPGPCISILWLCWVHTKQGTSAVYEPNFAEAELDSNMVFASVCIGEGGVGVILAWREGAPSKMVEGCSLQIVGWPWGGGVASLKAEWRKFPGFYPKKRKKSVLTFWEKTFKNLGGLKKQPPTPQLSNNFGGNPLKNLAFFGILSCVLPPKSPRRRGIIVQNRVTPPLPQCTLVCIYKHQMRKCRADNFNPGFGILVVDLYRKGFWII